MEIPHCPDASRYPLHQIRKQIQAYDALRYILIDLDNGGKKITAAEAAKGLKPFVKE